MSDKININKKDVHVPDDSDGKADFSEGNPEESELTKATGAKYDSVREAFAEKDNFWDGIKKVGGYVKDTLAGQNKVGRIGGILKDAASFIGILPGWMNKGSDMIGNTLEDKSKKDNNMNILRKAFSIQGIKDFVKFKDEDGNFSWEQVGVSLLQIVVFVLLAWLDSQFGLNLIGALSGG